MAVRLYYGNKSLTSQAKEAEDIAPRAIKPTLHVYLPPICRISQKRLNNATPCVTAARRPLLHANAYTTRPVGLLHDAFHRGQSAVLLTVSAQNLFRLRLWNKAPWGGVFSGRPAATKTSSHCDSTETGQAPSTACITPLFISGDMVGSRHTRPEKLRLSAADVSPPSAGCNNWALVQRTRHRRVTTDSVCDQPRQRSGGPSPALRWPGAPPAPRPACL